MVIFVSRDIFFLHGEDTRGAAAGNIVCDYIPAAHLAAMSRAANIIRNDHATDELLGFLVRFRERSTRTHPFSHVLHVFLGVVLGMAVQKL